MTIEYMDNKRKSMYIRVYPFLKEFIENKNVTSIDIRHCRTLPLMENKRDTGGSYIDTYIETWHEFNDDKNVYRLEDVHFQAGHKDDSADDHAFRLYVKDNTIKPILLMLSGPSGVGKGPIVEWLKKLYFPGLLKGENIPELCQVKVRKTKTEKHKGTEDDLGFKDISNDVYELDCRGNKQIIDLHELDNALESHDAVLLESYYSSFYFLKARYENYADFLPVFISPLNKEEIKELIKQNKSLEEYLLDIMPNSLIERSRREGKVLSYSLIKDLEIRAKDSVNEMRFAHNYKKIIPNHYPESHIVWNSQNLIGEPRRVVDTLYQLIKTGKSDLADNGKDYDFGENLK